MTRALQRYRALDAGDRRLIREAAALLCLIRIGLGVLPFAVLRRAVGSSRKVTRAEFFPARVSWSVAAAARYVPFRTTCLTNALAVDGMMRRRGYATEIRFGVRPPEGGALAAHAWVEHDGKVVFGETQDLARYSVLSAQHLR
jgi:hypothetical protein